MNHLKVLRTPADDLSRSFPEFLIQSFSRHLALSRSLSLNTNGIQIRYFEMTNAVALSHAQNYYLYLVNLVNLNR